MRPRIDFWICNDESVNAARSNHIILGYEQYLDSGYRYQFDVYYKDIYNTLTYIEDRSAFDQAVEYGTIKDLLQEGDGEAWGLEAFVHKKLYTTLQLTVLSLQTGGLVAIVDQTVLYHS